MTDKTPLPVLLVVEDDEGLQRQLKWAYEGYEVVCAGDREAAIEALRAHEPAVVTLDLGLPPDPDGTTEGFGTLEEILRLKPDTKVIVATGHGAHESALKAIALGAYDFYRKPVDIDALGMIVSRAFHLHDIEAENRRLEGNSASTVLGSIVTAAPEMLTVGRTIERVASADVSVMLLGASGTGKELLAQAVHEKSGRKGGFVAINCAAIPENLLEAELFGYERGAFTGAVKSNVGKIELAQGGTLFLDEVGDIPLPLQVKLLRFLQERVIERIGGRQPIAVDTRIVCATHQDLEAMIGDGRFREDLYYRLAEIVVKIPSLAERAGDAVLLARHFVNRFGRELNPGVQSLSSDAIDAIDAYAWPGNVRELENRIKRAVIMADGKCVTAGDLDLQTGIVPSDDVLPINLRAAREIADRKAIRQAMSRTDNNISGAAKLLGVSRPTLYDLLKQYRLQA
jgi:two-component system NtrC family response regulator